MALPLTADKLVDALRAEGVRIVQHGSWRTHNRNNAGPWGPVHGVMIHHTVTTGTASSVNLCYKGRSDLPGPLCHGVIAKDGTVYLVGHGRANHAGSGDADVLQAVIAERPLPPDNDTNADGNTHFYGFEAINMGDNRDPWPPEQVEAIVRASAAICRAHGWGRDGDTSVIGHLEWQPGKIDPRGPGISMSNVRARVAERLRHRADWNPDNPDDVQEDDMPAPQPLALGMTEPFDLGADSWASLAWKTEWADGADQHFDGAQTFAADGALYQGTIWVYAEGIPPGRPLQLRLVDCDATGAIVRRLPIAGPPAADIADGDSDGTVYCSYSIAGQVPRGQRVKAMLRHLGPEPIRITRAEIKGLVWP